MKFVVLGGTSGLGLCLSMILLERGHSVTILGRTEPRIDGAEFVRFNLLSDDVCEVARLAEAADGLILTAGAGRAAAFEDLQDWEVQNAFRLNAEGAAKVLHAVYGRIRGERDFYCAVLSSVAGLLASPLMAVYGAAKAASEKLVESINAELREAGKNNRVLNVCPGFFSGTRFDGGENQLEKVRPMAEELLERMFRRETFWIPRYEEVYRGVLERYHADPEAFALDSCRYKREGGRLSKGNHGRVGFLSGTFDLFHIGHLNLLRRAKQYCDYLVVGVHPETSKHKNKPVFIPLEERMEIVGACRYVDKVVVTLDEDDDMHKQIPYDLLFVGSDYKGTERFRRYEENLTPLGVRIIYFPYTQGTSSTQLREAIERNVGKKES